MAVAEGEELVLLAELTAGREPATEDHMRALIRRSQCATIVSRLRDDVCDELGGIGDRASGERGERGRPSRRGRPRRERDRPRSGPHNDS